MVETEWKAMNQTKTHRSNPDATIDAQGALRFSAIRANITKDATNSTMSTTTANTSSACNGKADSHFWLWYPSHLLIPSLALEK